MTLECGYDAGDCGVEKITQNMVQIRLDPTVVDIVVNASEPSLAVNLTGLYPKGEAGLRNPGSD